MLAFTLFLASVALAQQLPNSYPHPYPGLPNTRQDFHDSRAWQDYFHVKDSLPNQTFSMERSFAGNLPVNRPQHPNDTLFFWAFEKSYGSLTREAEEDCTEPWMIWLNGGPGASSMIGLVFENGPLHVTNSYSLVKNEFSWNKLADTIWIDQPAGVGYSTADNEGYIFSEDQMGEDFLGFLSNLVQVFPSLRNRPLQMAGESYAGIYIPYITKAYFSTPNPPVHLAKIVIGDGATGGLEEIENLPVLNIIETYPQIIGYDPDAYKFFRQQAHLCGLDLNITYPQRKALPPFSDPSLGNATLFQSGARSRPKALTSEAFRSALARTSISHSSLSKRELALRAEGRADRKRDLSNRANGTIDPFYGCFLLFELADFAVNFTKPWSINDSFLTDAGIDFYDIPDALDPEAPQNASVFLNHPQTRTALHAPTVKNWTEIFTYPFENNLNNSQKAGTNVFGDPSPPASSFLSELATNCSAHGIKMVFYSGNDDLLVAHLGTEVTIQNMTFMGIRGFTRKPSTPWYSDNGNFAGIIHQERNVTYALFDHAGHLVPAWQPQAAFTFVREFILGSNPNGTVLPDGRVVGGEDHPLVHDVLPGEHNPIFTGSGTTMGSTLWPSATIAAWDKFIATAAATPTPHDG